jgi:sulfate/thiosulfate transport system substrate-binding protein
MLLDRRAFLGATAASLFGAAGGCKTSGSTSEILNVSYDPTRELYETVNKAFAASQKAKGKAAPTIKQSHGGSGKQARAVIDGLKADVVTLALAYDIDQLVKKGLVQEGWQARLANGSCPFTSTIVFLVRAGNPKGIKTWDDLANDGVSVITPNPKTSGGARWNYLAAFGYELGRSKDEAKATSLVKRIFKNVPVLDSGARGSTTTFVERNIGDVLIAWENEALLSVNELGKGKFEIVVPEVSILAEPPVALVDKVADERKTRALAEEYLAFLYEAEAQALAAKHYFRPTAPDALAAAGNTFAKVELFKMSDVFGSWAEAQAKHFDDSGTFDQIYQPS